MNSCVLDGLGKKVQVLEWLMNGWELNIVGD